MSSARDHAPSDADHGVIKAEPVRATWAARIEREVAYFRANPDDADATPRDVLSIADQAIELAARLSDIVDAAKALVADDDIYRETGRRVPRDAGYWADLRAAIAKAVSQ